MKNIKLRIVYLILGAALLLFALFMLAVNVVIPAHFVSEAEKALRNPALCFLSWRTATSPTHGARTPIGWRKSCWRIAVNGLLHPIDATTSRQTSTT